MVLPLHNGLFCLLKLIISVTAVFLVQVYYKQRDYWPFVWCVRYISPHLASHVEQVWSLKATCRVVWKYFHV